MAHRILSLDKVARGPSFFRRHLETARVIRRSPRIAIGLSMVLVFVLIALLAPWISPYDPIKINLRAKYTPPSATYWVGTDNVGRDVLSRLIWGTRVSLATAVLSIVFAVILGGLIGVAAGFFGGKLDTFLCGFVDILLALPAFILAIILMGALGRGFMSMIFSIGIGMAPRIARLVRGSTLVVKEREFVEAAKSIGYGDWRIICRHILPHCLTPLVVYSTVMLGSAVMLEAGLSFLGLGIAPPTPSWGQMVTEGAAVMRTIPWIVTTAGSLIVILVLAFNLLGDGLRDQLDPSLRGEKPRE